MARSPAGTAARRRQAPRSRGREASAQARAVRSSVRLGRVPRRRPRLGSSGRARRTSSTIQRAQQVVDVDVVDGVLSLRDLVHGDDGLEGRRADGRRRCSQTIASPHRRSGNRVRADQEAVELRSGSGNVPSCSIGFSVASDEERLRQQTRVAVDRHLPLRHRLQQRRLRLRHRAVDLVDEQDVREDGPGPELELTRSSGRRSKSPVTSVGWRSGVHWMREGSRP